MNFFKKLIYHIKKDKKNEFSFLTVFLKAIFSIIVMFMLPVIFFIIFIFKEPRELGNINSYVFNRLKETINIKEIKYKSAKITINKDFRVVYIVDEMLLEFNDLTLKFPNIILEMNLFNIIKNKFFFDNIIVKDLVSYFGYDDKDSSDIKYISKSKIHNIIDFIYRENTIFNNLSIIDSNFYFFDKKNKSLDKLEVKKSKIKINKDNLKNLNFDFTLLTSMNNEKNISSKNYCIINENKDVKCNSSLYNLYTSSLFRIINKNIINYSENINGLFNIEFNTYFKNYTDLKNTKFKIHSNYGNFFIKEIFEKKINYKNLLIEGSAINNDNITLNKVSLKLSDNNSYSDVLINLNFKKNDFIDLIIKLKSLNLDKLEIFWPTFLKDSSVYNWVKNSIKNGNIDEAYANMSFKYNKSNYELNEIKSEILFSNVFLNYSDNFPQLNSLYGNAIFTIEDMNININNGILEKTKIKDASIYTKFNDKIPVINIKAKTYGNSEDLLYFINYSKKKEIKKISDYILNGKAKTDVKINIPLVNDLDFNKTYIELYTNVININNDILRNNSSININLDKNNNSNNINLKIDLTNSNINLDNFGFIKNKNDNLSINSNILISDNFIEINNIESTNDLLSFDGSILLENEKIKKINFNNIKIGGVNAYLNYNNNYLDLYSNRIYLNFKNSSSSKIIDIDNILSNYNLKLKFDDIKVNNNYSIKSFYLTNENNNLKIDLNGGNLESNKKNNKYEIYGNIKNLGEFLHNVNITSNLIGGDLYFNGEYENNNLNISVRIKNKFDILTSSIKDTKFFRNILKDPAISEKTKKKLKNDSSLSFDSAAAEIYFYENNIIKIKSFFLNSAGFFGIGMAGKGKIYLKEGKMNSNGIIIPADKINKLFGLNKIPLINNIIFDGKNGGLFTIGYEFNKNNYDSEYDFSLKTISRSSFNSIKNALLILLML